MTTIGHRTGPPTLHLPGFEPTIAPAAAPDPAPPVVAPAPVPADEVDDVPVSDQDQVPATPFTVEVIRSARRKRTVGAQLVGGVLRVTVPSWMSRSEEAQWVETMTRRFRRSHQTGRIDLMARARTLANRYDLPRPADVRWGGEMTTRWGSCTPSARTIRLSDRLAAFPGWVLDYVLVHEMAHIAVPDHSPAFWHIVHRYPRAERAIGYLIAKSGDDPDDDAFDDVPAQQDA